MNSALGMVVIYEYPSDFPGVRFVAREWRPGRSGVIKRGAIIAKGDDIEVCRQAADERGYGACLPRTDGDDPVILEVWL